MRVSIRNLYRRLVSIADCYLNVVALDRFKNEVLRIYGVLEIHLSGKYTGQVKEYLAGIGEGKYSVADISTWRRHFSLPTRTVLCLLTDTCKLG